MAGAQQGLSVLWQGIGGQASRSLMDHFAEILFALNKHCFSYLSIWIKEAMQQDGFPSARVSPEQKETFSQQILRFVHPSLWWLHPRCGGNDPPCTVSCVFMFVPSLCLSRERVNKRRVKEMVKEFTLLCRGLHGTEYTADY